MHKIWVLWPILIYRNPFLKNIFWKCIKGALLTSVPSKINFRPFRIIRGPLFHKPVIGQELFFSVSYSKLALERLYRATYVQGLIHSIDIIVQHALYLHCPIFLSSIKILRVRVCITKFRKKKFLSRGRNKNLHKCL